MSIQFNTTSNNSNLSTYYQVELSEIQNLILEGDFDEIEDLLGDRLAIHPDYSPLIPYTLSAIEREEIDGKDGNKLLRLLIKQGARIPASIAEARPILFKASLYVDDEVTLQFLQQLPFTEINSKEWVLTLMQQKDLSLLEFSIDAGLQLGWKSNTGTTLLHLAIENSFYEGAEYLLDEELSLESKDCEGLSPLDFLFSKSYFRNFNAIDFDEYSSDDVARALFLICMDTGGILETESFQSAFVPKEMVYDALENGHRFRGRPRIIDFTQVGAHLIPQFDWTSDFLTSNRSLFTYKTNELREAYQRVQRKTHFSTFKEMNEVFQELKDLIPQQFLGTGCSAKAHWLSHLLKDLLRFDVEILTVSPKNHSKIVTKPPFPEQEWTYHQAVVVSLFNEETLINKYVLDPLLDHPIPVAEWTGSLPCFNQKTKQPTQPSIKYCPGPPAVETEDNLLHFLSHLENLRYAYLFENISQDLSFETFEVWEEHYFDYVYSD